MKEWTLRLKSVLLSDVKLKADQHNKCRELGRGIAENDAHSHYFREAKNFSAYLARMSTSRFTCPPSGREGNTMCCCV